MKKNIHEILRYVFSLIAGVSIAGVIFVGSTALKDLSFNYRHLILVCAIVIIPLFIEVLGSFGLIFHWFQSEYLTPGKIIGFLQWIAGAFGAAAIFDSIMRLTKRMYFPDNVYWFSLDAIFLALFFLWMLASYLINDHADNEKHCEFC